MKLRTMIAAALQPWVRVRDTVNGVTFVDAPALDEWIALRVTDESVTLDYWRFQRTTSATAQVRRGRGPSFSTWGTRAKVGNLHLLFCQHGSTAARVYSSDWRADVLKPLSRPTASAS